MGISVAVLGAGSWGTTFAALASRNARVTLWARNPDTAERINRTHLNDAYLPQMPLPARLVAGHALGPIVSGADVIVVAVPSHGFRAVVRELAGSIRPWVPVISLAKGLEQGSRLRMSQIITEELPGHPVGVLCGPNLAREILSGKAAASVLAMNDAAIQRRLQEVFSSGLFRVYTNADVAGCELGGVLKNVIAIACGMGDGMGAGDNTRAAMLTRGLAEITRLGVALGGRAETFAGLAGFGDLVTTCTSALSRNRRVGVQLARGLPIGEIVARMPMIAEGVRSTPAALELAAIHGIDVPMIREVNRVLGGASARRAFRALLAISAGTEADPG